MTRISYFLLTIFLVPFAQSSTFSLSNKIYKNDTFCFLESDKVLVAHSSYQSNLARLKIERLSTGEVLYTQPQSEYSYRFMCTDKKVFGFDLSRRVQYNVLGNDLTREAVDPILYSKAFWDTEIIFDQDLFAQGIIHSMGRKPVPEDNWKYYAYDINSHKATQLASIVSQVGANSVQFADGYLLSIGLLTGQSGKIGVQIQEQRTGQINLTADLSASVEGSYADYAVVPAVLFQPLQKKFVIVSNSELQFWDYSSGQAVLTKRTKIGDNGQYERNIKVTPDGKYYILAVKGFVKIANARDGSLVYSSPNQCGDINSFHLAGDIFFSPDQKWIGVNYSGCTYLISRHD